MTIRNMIKVLSRYNNCYVNDIPSEYAMKKLKIVFNCDFRIIGSESSCDGYVIEKVKEAKTNVGY